MIENKNNTDCLYCDRSCPILSRPSLFQTLNIVKEQVEYRNFRRYKFGQHQIEPIYKDLCLIIAEMYVRNSDDVVRVKGADIRAHYVQEVYRALNYDHITLVVENLKKQKNLIRNKTAYLQTALYNVVFELEAHYINLVNHDMNS